MGRYIFFPLILYDAKYSVKEGAMLAHGFLLLAIGMVGAVCIIGAIAAIKRSIARRREL